MPITVRACSTLRQLMLSRSAPQLAVWQIYILDHYRNVAVFRSGVRHSSCHHLGAFLDGLFLCSGSGRRRSHFDGCSVNGPAYVLGVLFRLSNSYEYTEMSSFTDVGSCFQPSVSIEAHRLFLSFPCDQNDWLRVVVFFFTHVLSIFANSSAFMVNSPSKRGWVFIFPIFVFCVTLFSADGPSMESFGPSGLKAPVTVPRLLKNCWSMWLCNDP